MGIGSKPKKQKEPQDVKDARERQARDLARVDEEQNRRIKQMFLARSGGRVFRASGAAKMSGNSAGAGAAGAAGSAAPSSGGSIFRRIRALVR